MVLTRIGPLLKLSKINGTRLISEKLSLAGISLSVGWLVGGGKGLNWSGFAKERDMAFD